MGGWMESDGVLSSFHFNVFSNSLRIRSPYAPPHSSDPLEFQRVFLYVILFCEMNKSGFEGVSLCGFY